MFNNRFIADEYLEPLQHDSGSSGALVVRKTNPRAIHKHAMSKSDEAGPCMLIVLYVQKFRFIVHMKVNRWQFDLLHSILFLFLSV